MVNCPFSPPRQEATLKKLESDGAYTETGLLPEVQLSLGSWLAELKTESANDILNAYLKPSVAHFEDELDEGRDEGRTREDEGTMRGCQACT